MTFGFSTGWAKVLVCLGFTVMVIAVALGALAAAVPSAWTATKIGTVERIAIVAAGVVAGAAVGGLLVVMGQLILAFLNVRENVERFTARSIGEDEVPCPYCAEEIRPEAALCPHCRSDLRRTTAADRLLAPR